MNITGNTSGWTGAGGGNRQESQESQEVVTYVRPTLSKEEVAEATALAEQLVLKLNALYAKASRKQLSDCSIVGELIINSLNEIEE